MLEGARDGVLVAELMQSGRTVLTRDAVHDVVPREDRAAGLHQLGHQDAVAGALEHVVGDQCRRLGQVELQPTALTAAGELGGVGEQQPFLLVRSQVHSGHDLPTSAEPGR